MKYIVDDGCIGCGVCEATCPEVFTMNDMGVAEAIDDDVPEELEEMAAEAQASCPVDVILEED